jgi:hypothetical protein
MRAEIGDGGGIKPEMDELGSSYRKGVGEIRSR